METKKKKGLKIPHTFIVLLSITLLMTILTWVIPAGEFERMDLNGRTVVVPGSYQVVESNPQSPFDFLMSIPKGLEQAGDIVFFVFIVGGVFRIFTESGMVQAGVGALAKKLKGKEKLIIPIVLLVFAIGGATMGMSEETIVFIPVGIALALAMGFDALTGMAMITMGAAIGFYAGILNPFNVGVAQTIGELPMFSGWEYRLLILAVLWVITSAYLVHYAGKVKADPTKSVIYGLPLTGAAADVDTEVDHLPEFTLRLKLVLLAFVGGFFIIAFGVFQYGWYLNEISAVFLAMGLITGVLTGQGPSKLAETFVEGASEVIFAALAIGIARSILVVMSDGKIIDTLVYYLSNLISSLPKTLSVIGMYISQIIINFFIPSGSGQAAATMPIMIPLADHLEITRQTSVLAFQFGDGFMDSIIPTSGVLMAQLSLAGVPYERWAKFIGKLMVIWLLVGMVFLLIANGFNYGPF